MSPTQSKNQLAINGGEPAIRQKLPPMYPGGLRIGEEEEQAVLEVLRSKRLFRYYGPQPGPSRVAELESEFAVHWGVKYSVALTSGTASLICGLAGLGIGPGDEVIVPAYTWIASAEAVMLVGAVPVLAEVDESLTLDPADVERKITSHTKALMPVHMRGAPARMNELLAIAQRHHLKIVEDTAQACGGSYHGKRLGSIGDVGAFSFQFNKIITCGEGGMVITSDQNLYQRMLMVHDVVGGLRNNIPAEEIIPGMNFRMSELQGALMLVQLHRLEKLLGDMRQRKNMLQSAVKDVVKQKGLQFRATPDAAGDTAISLVMFAPSVQDAQKIAEALRAEGASASVLYQSGKIDYHHYCYWAPVLNKRAWSENGGPWRWHEGEINYTPEMCPQTLALVGRAVHLDISPDLTNQNVEELAEAMNKVLSTLL